MLLDSIANIINELIQAIKDYDYSNQYEDELTETIANLLAVERSLLTIGIRYKYENTYIEAEKIISDVFSKTYSSDSEE